MNAKPKRKHKEGSVKQMIPEDFTGQCELMAEQHKDADPEAITDMVMAVKRGEKV